MTINKDFALKLWDALYPGKEFVQDCFGTWICRNAYSNEAVSLKMPGDDKYYDYSWNIDHIKPKSLFSTESEADNLNNLHIIHRQNNLEKSDKYPSFTIKNKSYRVVVDVYGGYGIMNSSGFRIDKKAKHL